MSIPADAVEPPARVIALARGAALEPVWVNELGGLTFRTDDDRYIKFGPLNAETSFAAEAERLEWARTHTPVPRVLELGGDATHEWLVTAALPGPARSRRGGWPTRRPPCARSAKASARCTRHLPVDGVPVRLERAGAHRERGGPRHPRARRPARGAAGRPARRLPRRRVLPQHARRRRRAVDGHVDLGALGVGDRWADIAVAAMSTSGTTDGWETALIEAYGIEPDQERLAYYRELWNAT